MKIYLAARYSRHLQMQAFAAELKALGHEVTSRWIWGNHQISDRELNFDKAEVEAKKIRFGQEDTEDIEAADAVINFTEIPRTTKTRGGRHYEMGYAAHAGKILYVVGPKENIFHCMPGVIRFDTTEALLEDFKK